jgi:hypothetical protein
VVGRVLLCSEKTIAPLYKGTIYSPERSAVGQTPSTGFCIDWLLGSKYAGQAK